MKAKRALQWIGMVVLAVGGVAAFRALPQTRAMPGGYTYAYFPVGGHRYLIAPEGIKKVGQEVLSYRVEGSVVSGTVRWQLGGNDVRSFRLDTKTHQVTFSEPIQPETSAKPPTMNSNAQLRFGPLTRMQVVLLALVEAVGLVLVLRLWNSRSKASNFRKLTWTVILLVPVFGPLTYALIALDPAEHGEDVGSHWADAGEGSHHS